VFLNAHSGNLELTGGRYDNLPPVGSRSAGS